MNKIIRLFPQGEKVFLFKKGLGFKGILQRILPVKTHFSAVDIGMCKIKVVEIGIINGQPRVTTFSKYPTPEKAFSEGFEEESLVASIREAVQQAGIQGKEVISAIGGERVVTRHIRVPFMQPNEIKNALNYEVEKFVPIPINELIIRYIILDETEIEGNKQLHLLLAVVPLTVVYQYHAIFARAGLILTAIDLHSLALRRAFLSQYLSGVKRFSTIPANEINTSGAVAIMDIGAATTHLVVVKDFSLLFTRSMPVGGDLLTRSIADSMNIDFEKAQKLKEEEAEILVSIDDGSLEPGSLKMQLDFSLRTGLTELVMEIRRSLDFYKSLEHTYPISYIILTGGLSNLKGFTSFLSDALGLPVKVGMQDIVLPELENLQECTFDPAFSIAFGLALREVVD